VRPRPPQWQLMSRQAFLLIPLLAWLLLIPTKTQGQIPRGVFSLAASGQVASNNALANPDVVGMSIRQDWAALEPSEGNFDWSYLDSEVAQSWRMLIPTTSGFAMALSLAT